MSGALQGVIFLQAGQRISDALKGGDPLTMVYLGCVLMGIFYSVLIMFFGSLSHGDPSSGGGGFHLSSFLGGHGSGDAGSGGVHTGVVAISFLSPLSITTFTTGFGSLGLILLLAVGMKPMHTIFYAAGGSILLDIIINYALFKIFIQSQGSSVTTIKELIGTHAEVILTIPLDGNGEIWYDTKTGRQTSSAKSLIKEEIHKGDLVEITEFIGGVALVKRIE